MDYIKSMDEFIILLLSFLQTNLGRLRQVQLPNPEILRATIDRLLRAFENATQTEILENRLSLIKSLILFQYKYATIV